MKVPFEYTGWIAVSGRLELSEDDEKAGILPVENLERAEPLSASFAESRQNNILIFILF